MKESNTISASEGNPYADGVAVGLRIAHEHTFRTGQDLSEVEIITKGCNFLDWEKGFTTAINIIRNNIEASLKKVKEGDF